MNDRKINIYFVAAVPVFICIGILYFVFGYYRDIQAGNASRTEYPIIIFGDSIVGQCRDQTSVSGLLNSMLDEPVFNAAFGGTCMAAHDQDISTNYTMEMLNMVNISKAIAADDFGVQQTVHSKREITFYFGDTVDELEYVDFQSAKVMILAFGINDYHAGTPLDNDKDPYDERTYGGALRSVITTMRELYPDLRIVLVTPTYAWYRSNGLTCEEYDTGGYFLEEYVNKEISVAEELGVEAIDLYHDLYPHRTWDDWKIYTEDGLHPNEDGRRMIAEIIVDVLTYGEYDGKEQ